MTQFATIEQAIADLRQGRMIILVDDERRENEGDLIIAAEKVTPEAISFMLKHTSGIVCLALTEETIERLNIPSMPERNRSKNQAIFTASIEAAHGVTTGVSAHDRAHTIQLAINPSSRPKDISMPGHVFPLKARKGGVLERDGHTEGSIDLMKLAGLQHAATICELMNEDGTMSRLPNLEQFAKQYDIKIVKINDIIAHRLAHETVIEEVASALLPLKDSRDFQIKIFRHKYDLSEHIALVHKDYQKNQPCLVRLHSECCTGDIFHSLLCDCGQQLELALKQVAEAKGVILYMRQEGRGIGLSNKIKAYHLQQTEGLDTVEANHKLGFLGDHRHYGMSAQILHHLGIKQIRFLTNNPRKISDMQSFGIEVVERVPLETSISSDNQHYLKTKRDKLGHFLSLSEKL